MSCAQDTGARERLYGARHHTPDRLSHRLAQPLGPLTEGSGMLSRYRLTRSAAMVRLAILAALAIVASMLASAGVAAAQEGRSAEVLPRTSACVGAALDSFEFEDVGDLGDEWQDAINCIAYYGVTVGTTPDTYDPDSDVTRSQMALFLYRAARASGVDFTMTADDPVAMFSDTDGLGDVWLEAIGGLYGKGIMTGRNISGTAAVGSPSSETFVPHEPINRAEMATYLRNLVRAASPDLFDSDGDLESVESLDQFDDARQTTTAATSDVIAAVYELGITTGRNATTFDPTGTVRRSNMALFLARTLAHTTARPAGLSVQQDGTMLVVSLRDRRFQPVDTRHTEFVDVFVADIDDADDAFNSDGSCDTDLVREVPRWHHDPCVIDAGDAQLEDGDAEIDLGDDLTSDGFTAWVWLGRLDDEADEDDALSVMFDPRELPPPAPSQLTVTFTGLRSRPDGSPVLTARKGATVRVNLQLQGSYADETDLVSAVTPGGGAMYELVLVTTVPDGSDPDSEPDVYEQSRVQEISLAADGSASFTLPSYRFDDYAVEYSLTSVGDAPFADPASGVVHFTNTDPAAASVVVDPLRDWLSAGIRVDDEVRNSVRVTVFDQYGRPMSGQTVLLLSKTDDVDTPGFEVVTRGRDYVTSRSGVVIGYTRTGGSAVETLTAGIDRDAVDEPGHGRLPEDCDDVPVSDANSNDVCGDAEVYWTDEADLSSGSDTYVVVHADVRNQKIVVREQGGTSVVVVDYEDTASGDVFDVDHEPGGRTYAEDLAAFESALVDVNDSDDEYQLVWDQSVSRRWTFNLITSR